MMFQIDLSSNGELLLTHNGRSVEISASIQGLLYIKEIIYESHKGMRDHKPGYIADFPTQHAVNKFLAKKNMQIQNEKAAAAREKAKGLGIDLDKMEFTL